MNKDLLAVAARLLHEEGWAALRLERIAEAAGVSRATVWRHGLTRRSVEQLLRGQLAADYQALMWEPLTMPGTGGQRFAAALRALCAVAGGCPGARAACRPAARRLDAGPPGTGTLAEDGLDAALLGLEVAKISVMTRTVRTGPPAISTGSHATFRRTSTFSRIRQVQEK